MLNESGEFDFLFKNTDEPGIWKVKLLKSGTNHSVSDTFTVGSGTFLLELNEKIEDLNDKTKEGFENLSRLIATYPKFPGKQEMERNLKEIISTTAQLRKILSQTDKIIDHMEEEFKKSRGNIPEKARQALSKAFSTSVKTHNLIGTEIPELESLIKESKKETEWCYIWMLYKDLCDKLSSINNLVATGLKDICQNLLVAKTTQGMPFELSQYIGTTITLITLDNPSIVGLINYIAGTISSLGSAVYGELSKNCTVYKGKCEGDYSASLLHKNVPFFTMSYRIIGEMILTFQNRRPGDPKVYLKGRLKGQSKDFESSITMVPFMLPSSFTLSWSRSPVPLLASRSFLLYFEGEAMDDLIKIKLKGSGYDFNLKARGYYVILSAHHPLPIPGSFEFPLMNAEWFFSRVTKTAGKPAAYIDLPIKVVGKNVSLKKEFERRIYLPPTRRRKAVSVKMKFKIRLKNSK